MDVKTTHKRFIIECLDSLSFKCVSLQLVDGLMENNATCLLEGSYSLKKERDHETLTTEGSSRSDLCHIHWPASC